MSLLLAWTFLWPGPAAAAGHKTFTHEFFLYAVDYPEDWRLRTLNNAVSIAAPAASEKDGFAENVQIVAEDLKGLPAEITLVDYHRTGAANARKFLGNFRVLEEARTRWLGRDTIVMLYTASVRGKPFKFKDYKFMAGKTVYVLTYSATPEDFDAYLGAAENIMRSIRVSP